VVLNITISREEQEQSLQQTTLRIRSSEVNDRTKQLRDLAEKQNGRIRSSSFSRDPNGREFANVSLRVPMKNYSALMQSLNTLGKVEDVTVRRDDRPDSQVNQADAPADIAIQVYSQGNIVSEETGVIATLRRTIGQGAAALMWSARMIGVALAFLAPWVLAIVGVGWVARRVSRARRARKQRVEDQDRLS
jgi:glycine cleavage system regulatory protein